MGSSSFRIYSLLFASSGIPATIAHADLWSANILFDHSNNNRLVAIIDWQSTQAGEITKNDFIDNRSVMFDF